MTVTSQRGPGMLLPGSNPIFNRDRSGGAGMSAIPSGPISFPAGAAQLVPPGQFVVYLGPNVFLQFLDPILNSWRVIETPVGAARTVFSDGTNFRLINLTGCVVGALMTNAGTGYTSAPTVAASAGGSTWRAVVGGAINTTVTITTAGSGYTYAPTLVISAPPVGGIQATATCTISGGAINAVTVTNAGGGYTARPTITVIPDPRDTTGSGGVLTVNSTLAGAGTITGLICTDPGTPQTSVPTLAFTGGGGASAAATAIMAFAATGFTVGAGGAAYGNAQPFLIQIPPTLVAGTPANTNPRIEREAFQPRGGVITGVSTAGGAITATAAVVQDAGLFQAVPNGFVIAGGSGLATTVGQATITVGGVVGYAHLLPF